MIGEQIEHYRIDAIQGQGGLGTVYRAYDTNLIRPVALKLILPQFAQDATFKAHIMQEAKAAAKLIHPHIATIYNFNNQDKHLYLVSEFVTGYSMSHLLAQMSVQQRPLRLADSLQIGAEVADALAYAHQQGVLHRNLKPTNILLKPLENKRASQLDVRPLVTDFGLTRQLDGDVKSNPITLGADLNYLSPEHCIGNRLDGRSDIYVLGLLLYELIAGKRPFQIYTSTEAMIMHALETPIALSQLVSGLPTEVEEIIQTAIAKPPEKRYQDMHQLSEKLRQAAQTYAAFEQPNQLTLQALLDNEPKQNTAVDTTGQNKGIIEKRLEHLPVPEEDLVSILQEALASEAELPMEALDLAETSQVQTLPQQTPPLGLSRAAQPEKPDLVVIQRPGHHPKTVQLDKDKFIIGRSKENDIVLETSDVSRQHAQLEKTSAGWRVVDLNSTGGTYWGGHKLLPNVPEAWNGNQTLRIGPYSLRWLPARAPRPFRDNDAQADELTQLHIVPKEGVQTSSARGTFSLMINPVLIEVKPGSEGMMQVELFNQGAIADHFTLRITDLPQTVSSLSQNKVYLTPGERATLPITLTIPADNPMSAGIHPFQIIVQRESDKMDTAVISARLTVGSAENFSVGVWPLDIPQNGICQILIRNEGNTNGRYSITGLSSDPNVNFLGERGQVRIEPGEAKTLSMTVASGKRPLFGRRQQIPFDIKVRSETGTEKTESGQLQLKPRFPAWILPVLEIFLVILFAAIAISNNFSTSAQESTQTLSQEGETVFQEGDFGYEFGDEHGELPIGQFTPRPTIIPATAEAQLLDNDNDGLTNGDEFSFATDPNNPDSDGDGLLDGEEVGLYDTIPTTPDTDLDGLTDGDEVRIYQTNPLFLDTDLDGVSDGDEVADGTDPRQFPTDSSAPVVPSQPTNPPTNSSPVPTAVPTQPPAQPTSAAEPTTAATAIPTNTPIPTAVPTNTPTNNETITLNLPLIDSGTGTVSLNGQITQGIANLIRVGDTSEGDTIRGFFTYDITQIPLGASISSARLTFANDATVEGNPFVLLDCLLIEAAEFELPVDAADYDAFAFYIDCEAGPPAALNVLIDVQDALDFQLDYMQFRLAFNEDTNFDTQADQLVIRQAPTLEVIYSIP